MWHISLKFRTYFILSDIQWRVHLVVKLWTPSDLHKPVLNRWLTLLHRSIHLCYALLLPPLADQRHNIIAARFCFYTDAKAVWKGLLLMAWFWYTKQVKQRWIWCRSGLNPYLKCLFNQDIHICCGLHDTLSTRAARVSGGISCFSFQHPYWVSSMMCMSTKAALACNIEILSLVYFQRDTLVVLSKIDLKTTCGQSQPHRTSMCNEPDAVPQHSLHALNKQA